ncbi:MAG: pilin [Candidatus Nealsonbacteria bacterium DGGOD1a]|nr:MAG: pilin [Candidatus Nealsonbacteria bacterium DGGOD1a]
MKNFLKKKLIVPAIGLLIPALIFAADTGVGAIGQEVKEVNLEEVLINVRNLFFGAVIIASVFMILWGAFQYVTSSGDEKKTETAKKTITYAVIGLIVAGLAATIVSIATGLSGQGSSTSSGSEQEVEQTE